MANVALGKIIYDNNSSIVKSPYNCRWACKNNTDSQIIVFNTGQIDLLYLIELEF